MARVLVVEDERHLAMGLRFNLEADGHHVEVTADGETALERLGAEPGTCDAVLLDSTCQGAPGIDYVKWKRPVLAGDTLTGRLKVVARRLSNSRPGLGFVTMQAELANQRGEVVFELQNTAMFLTRGAAR